ncbi:hypothetical protein BST29_01760 [Mycobacterium malmoense]|uniref:Uncharacterized protein n=1 Tax=Mycobacterium malmoense TaxID=1780 RepID=A0ABX3SYU8_MYCMA|nr:hypothetical protein BST29_01760 [Mycobacterium malmoense]
MLDKLYSGPRTASKCAANARKLYNNANKAAIESEVVILSRDATGVEYKTRPAVCQCSSSNAIATN